ncbi:MAG TPA: DnaJ C-terminal domain-containing protein [Thermoanaerobaculia bacterium]
MEYKDYYATLGVAKGADPDEIQKAYRKLARKYHPDVNKDPDAETKFKEIGEAYAVLKDEDKRKRYDQFGSAWKQAQTRGGGGGAPPGWENVEFDFDLGGGRVGFDFGGMGGAEGFSSFFEMLFGGGRPGGPRPGGPGGPGGPGAGFRTGGPESWARKGADIEAPITLTLEEAATGGRRELVLTDPTTHRRKTVQVNIPRGLKPGQRIRLAGQGQEGSGGGKRGDLYLKIDLAEHPRFRLEGDDIYTELPVAPWEAVLGGEARLPTLDGEVTVRVPAGSSAGQKIRLRQRGFLRSATNGDQRGDLYATLRVVVPKEVSGREKELFEELAEVSEFDARG